MEISSSSYGLSLFSLEAGSRQDGGTGAVPGVSSSISMGELWCSFDRLDETSLEVVSAFALWSPLRDPAFILR
jgi:hypothetical protein